MKPLAFRRCLFFHGNCAACSHPPTFFRLGQVASGLPYELSRLLGKGFREFMGKVDPLKLSGIKGARDRAGKHGELRGEKVGKRFRAEDQDYPKPSEK